ncbi:MAG: hypothetical protein R2699_13810 [Acidimicrobiales bacterium]
MPEPSAGAGVGAALVAALVATARGLVRLAVRLVHLVVDAFLEVTHPARSESTTARRAAERVPVGDSRRRLIAVLAAGAVLFAVIAVRLAGLQLVEPDQLEAYGMAQRMRVHNVAADRGTITDRNGVELAVSAPADRLRRSGPDQPIGRADTAGPGARRRRGADRGGDAGRQPVRPHRPPRR